MEENFMNLCQQSIDTNEDIEEEFSDKTYELFNEKEQREQHAKQHVLEKGLKTCGKRGKLRSH